MQHKEHTYTGQNAAYHTPRRFEYSEDKQYGGGVVYWSKKYGSNIPGFKFDEKVDLHPQHNPHQEEIKNSQATGERPDQ